MTASHAPLWLLRAYPPLLGLVAIHVDLLPLAPGDGTTMPDLLYCMLFAFAARAPRALPAAVVLALGLLADLLLSRPLGLGALGLLAVTELVRAPAGAPRDWSPPREWLLALLAFVAMITAMTLILALSLAEPPAFAALRRHVIATAIAYPFVAALVGWLLGGRRAAAPARPGRTP